MDEELARALVEVDRAFEEAFTNPEVRAVLPPDTPAIVKEAVRQSLTPTRQITPEQRRARAARRAFAASRDEVVVCTPITCETNELGGHQRERTPLPPVPQPVYYSGKGAPTN